MFFEAFKITGTAVAQTFLLAAIGYFLVRRNLLGDACLNTISGLVIDVTLPLMIFTKLLSQFSFSAYPHWWVFPLFSIAITGFGLFCAKGCLGWVKDPQAKQQFLSLVGFQNSGYLPLSLVAAMLSPAKAGEMFIYIFLFLLGFNLAMFSLGIYIISTAHNKKFEAKSLFNPPVIATLVSLALIALGWGKAIPGFVLKPIEMMGDCTLPLALLVVGGNIAQIKLKNTNIKEIALMSFIKLVLMPALGMAFVLRLNLTPLVGLLIILQLTMPPATTLSLLVRRYGKDDLLVSQGIFYAHIISIITIPLFTSLYFVLVPR
ncbi:MAG: AEC family transporter [Candidatus Omnitrophica bacterium]|jgi:hypothetical protein|nr:AEC family transporter [Candidatus Omnitrophota bacterium]